MKKIFLLLIAISLPMYIAAQGIYYTKNGNVAFYSKAPLENIEAHNNEATSFFDIAKAEIAFSVLIKGFRFEKALMEEHFNDKYMESDKYPKATFTGKVTNPDAIKWETDGDYPITVEGTLSIHNVSKPMSTPASISIRNKKVSGKAKFNIRVADYQIKIPSVVIQNIAETVEVTVDCQYLPYEKK